MIDKIKNPVVLYIVMPVLIAIWPLLVRGVYIKAAQEKLDSDVESYIKANNAMLDILLLAPERAQTPDPNQQVEEFVYDRAVYDIASLCNIPSGKYQLASRDKINNSQAATVILSDIDLTTFAKFLSMIQAKWTKLKCDSVKLTKQTNIADEWDITIVFRYFLPGTD